jgi:hypothetical protein
MHTMQTVRRASERHGVAEGRQRSRRPDALLALVIGAGVALRLWQYLLPRPLWLDEVRLAAGVLRPWSELLDPLPFRQTAPVGFLVLQRSVVSLFGSSEYALRALPLACGLAALGLFARFARARLEPWTALLATTLISLAPIAIYYSAEAKQYASDLLIAVLLLQLAFEHPRSGALLAAGVLAPWFSQPAVFITGGLALWFLSQERRVLPMLAWGASGALVVLVARATMPPVTSSHMAEYWETGFLPWSGAAVPHALALVYAAFMALGAKWVVLAAVPLAALGGWRLGRDCMPYTAPAILGLAAAAAHVYPFGMPVLDGYPQRVIIGFLPSMCVLVAAGAAKLGSDSPRLGRAGVACLLGTVVLGVAQQIPDVREDVRPVLAFIAAQRQSTDALNLGWFGPSYMPYYGSELADMDTVTMGDVSGLRRRVWLVRAHGEARSAPVLVDTLGEKARRVQVTGTRGVELVLFEP